MKMSPRILGVGLVFVIFTKGLASNLQDPDILAEQMWQEAVSDNVEQAAKSHATHRKLLADANRNLTERLQANIKELNDSKKFPKLDVKQRAWLVSQLEERIREVNEDGALESIIRAQNGASAAVSKGATLYDAWDYAGESVQKGPGLHKLVDTQVANNSVSSIKVTKGFAVVVFDEEFGGQSTILTNSVERLNDISLPSGQGNWNDAISSFIVLKLPAAHDLN